MNHVYGISEIVGTSTESLDAAIRNGVARAAATVRDLDWFEVTEIRGHLEEGAIGHFQVGLKIGFRMEDPPSFLKAARASRMLETRFFLLVVDAVARRSCRVGCHVGVNSSSCRSGPHSRHPTLAAWPIAVAAH